MTCGKENSQPNPICLSRYISIRVITVFPVFRLLTDFVCLYTYEFLLSHWKIVRSSVILLLPLFVTYVFSSWIYSVVQHIFCFVFLRLVWPMLPISLDCPLLIAPLVFSTVYLLPIGCSSDVIKQPNKIMSYQFYLHYIHVRKRSHVRIRRQNSNKMYHTCMWSKTYMTIYNNLKNIYKLQFISTGG